jgi:exodeoxyribonuclease-1
LFRYRARNWPDTLTVAEHERWLEFRRQRLSEATALTPLTLHDYFAQIRTLRDREGASQSLLDQLETWGHNLAAEIGTDHAQELLLQGDLHFPARASA